MTKRGKNNKIGRIIIPANVNVWPHELETAKALANYGYTIEFKRKKEEYKVHSADAYVDGVLWEFKSPNGSSKSAVERNLRRGKHQSSFIVFDSQRFKRIPDFAIKQEILSRAPKITDIDKIIFINRHRECIDIYTKKR